MRFALVNPAWTYEGSTYFGCQDPHCPLELLFAFDQINAAGHEPLLIDAHLDGLSTQQVKANLDKARKAAEQLAIWLTLSLFIGAFSAALAATEGGGLRDGTWGKSASRR